MGILRFYGDWVRHLPYPDLINRRIPKPVDHLILDANGVCHDAAAENWAYGEYENAELAEKILETDPDEMLDSFFAKIGSRIISMVQEFQPRKSLVIAIDGVAPIAKIVQQRSRRYKASKTHTLNLDTRGAEVIEEEHQTASRNFDTSSITPGTELMLSLDAYLRQLIENNQGVLPSHVVYSSHLVRGEGEHKIFELFREGRIEVGSEEEAGASIVHGLDADLVMLTLLSPVPKLYLCRENKDRRSFVSIDALRKGIIHDMETELRLEDEALVEELTLEWEEAEVKRQALEDKVKVATAAGKKALEEKRIQRHRSFEASIQLRIQELESIRHQQVIRDFVVMVYLIGNDFLPHMICFDNVGVAINEHMIPAYKATKSCFTTEEGEIIWESFAAFLAFLVEDEEKMMKVVAAKNFKYPAKAIEVATKRKTLPPEEGEVEGRYEVTFDFDRFRNQWYEGALLPRTKGGNTLYQRLIPDGIEEHHIVDMCKSYMEGIQWILLYYLKGTKGVSQKYMYKYYYAPLLSDLLAVVDQCVAEESAPTMTDVKPRNSDPKFTPVHQLLSVIPPKSFDLIPKPFRQLVESGDLADMCPVDFIVELEGKEYDWQGVAIIPFLDAGRVMRAVEALREKIPDDYKEAETQFYRFDPKIRIARQNPRVRELMSNKPVRAKTEVQKAEQVLNRISHLGGKDAESPKNGKIRAPKKDFDTQYGWSSELLM
jgi:5'-3' exonuclease